LLEAATLNRPLLLFQAMLSSAGKVAPTAASWDYLETTMIGSNSFEEARTIGRQKAAFWEKQAASPEKAHVFRRWSLRDLRTVYGITPLE
jgi:hypothetical protein